MPNPPCRGPPGRPRPFARYSGRVDKRNDRGRAVLGALTGCVIVGGIGSVVGLTVLDHPHRAVWALVATLVVVAGARLVIPGRPWFASRYRGADAAVLLAVAGAIAYLSSYTSTMAVH